MPDDLGKQLIQGLLGGVQNAGEGFLGMFDNGLLGGLFDKIKDTPIGKMLNSFKDWFSNLLSSFTEKLNPDLSAAKKGSETQLTKFFKENSFGLNEAALKGVNDITTKYVTDTFYKNGVPELASNNLPTAAFTGGISIRDNLINYLIGDGKSTLGVLPPDTAPIDANNPGRVQTANKIVNKILYGDELLDKDGKPIEPDLSMLAANPPKGGVVKMLSDTQTDVAALEARRKADPNLQEEYKETAVTITISAAAPTMPTGNLPKLSVTNPKNTNHITTPPTTPAAAKPAAPHKNSWGI